MDLSTYLKEEFLRKETDQTKNLSDYTIENFDLAQPSDSDKEDLFTAPKICGLICKSTQQRFIGKICNSTVNEYQRESHAYETLEPSNCPHILNLKAKVPLDYKGFLILPQHRPFDMDLLRPFAKRVLFQLLQAIAIVHAAKLAHRDIKWSNLVWRYTDDETPHVYLIDFGRTMSTTEIDVYNPEAYKCPTEDVFRAGILFGEMLLGTIKFYDEFQKPHKLLKDYSKQKHIKIKSLAEDLFRKLTDLDPRKRLTARQALIHPYFEGETLSCPMPEGKDEGEYVPEPEPKNDVTSWFVSVLGPEEGEKFAKSFLHGLKDEAKDKVLETPESTSENTNQVPIIDESPTKVSRNAVAKKGKKKSKSWHRHRVIVKPFKKKHHKAKKFVPKWVSE